MIIRETNKYYVFCFNSYRIQSRDCQNETDGPADVYISKSAWTKSAQYYGWGDATPLTPCDHNGNGEECVGEVLFDALRPDRIIRI